MKERSNKIMRAIIVGSMILLSIYSFIIIALELKFGQAYIRHYMTDIEGPVRFFAINTSISVFLLWSCAVLFLLIISITENWTNRGHDRLFYISQVLLFLYLGVDDRFKVHEPLGGIVGFNDAFVLLIIGAGELAVLYFLGNLKQYPKKVLLYLFVAGAFFGAMVFIDGFVQSELVLRLSLEDLTKTWASFFLFMFAWEICRDNIRRLRVAS